MSNDIKWKIRENGENPTFYHLYGSNFNTKYTSLVDYVVVRRLSHGLLSEIVKDLDCKGTPYFYGFAAEEFGLDLGLVRLESEDDFQKFKDIIYPLKCNQLYRVYVEVNRVSHVASYPNSLRKANPHVIYKMLLEFVAYNPKANINQARNYVIEKYHVLITPSQLSPGFERARCEILSINGDY